MGTTFPRIAALLILLATAAPLRAKEQAIAPVMDARFRGLDIVQHVQSSYPGLRVRAEEISHWSGYYNVNPVLLAELSLASVRGQLPGPSAPRELARLLYEQSRNQQPDMSLQTSLAEELSITESLAGQIIGKASQAESRLALPTIRKLATEEPPAMDLPFIHPEGWQFNGVHTWTGSDDDTPMSSLDFARSWSQSWGSDTSTDFVTAAHDGQVTLFSSCFVHVEHDRGWGTRYYHLDSLQVAHGDWVKAGDIIGVYADNEPQALCSGGHSNGPHVHFALQKDNAYHSLEGIELSGYRIHPGTSSYDTNHDRMWLEKRGQKFYGFGPAIAQEPGDNAIDYRYSGMWYSPDATGHGMNIEITEFPGSEGTRLSVFVAMYTYDDAGEANFYVASGDVDRWRSDEAVSLELLQTAGGDLSNLQSIDFGNPDHVGSAGVIQILFKDCGTAEVQFDITERTSGQNVEHHLELLRLIGVPRHVCEAASLPLPQD